MKSKIYTLIFLLVVFGKLYATDYYLSATGTGTGTGGWGNAAAGSSFFTSIVGTTLAAGTHIYIKAGSYTYTVTAPIYLSNNDVLIQAGFPTTATGTDLSGYDPIANPVYFTFNGPNLNEIIAFKSDGSGSASNLIEVKGLQMQRGSPNLTFFGGGNNDGGTYKFTDLSFANGGSNSRGFFVLDGLTLGGSAVFTNCYFSYISSAGGPAAINGGSAIPFSVVHCNFTYCSSDYPTGGSTITSSYPGIITISNSNFCTNYVTSYTAINGGGGAVAALGNNSVIFNISNCIFSSNFNNSGGGAAISCNNGVLHITNSQFLSNNNRSTVVGGGAIFMSHSIGGNTISNCIFSGNGCASNTTVGDGTSDGPGGGAINIGYDNTDFTISNSSFLSNSVRAGSTGGAIMLYNDKGAKATIKNCFFMSNFDFNYNFSAVGKDIIVHSAGAGTGTMAVITDTLQLPAQASYTNYGGTNTTAYSFSGVNIFNTPFTQTSFFNYTCPTYTQTIILPITVTNFTATKANNGNLITWQADNAINFSYFNVQRKDKNGNFITIAKVDFGSNYNFLDNAPANGTNYYRLAMVDKDGSVQYSKVVAISNNADGFVVTGIYPIPANNYVTIETFATTSGNVIYTIMDLSGKIIKNVSVKAVAGNNKYNINISDLSAGMYMANVTSSDGSATKFKVIKE